MEGPPGMAAPTRASSSSPWSARPDPAASALARPGHIGTASRLANTPGTATAAMGIAAKLSAIPATATVPSAAAVNGAVANVAPIEELRVRQPMAGPSARSLHRVQVVAPQRAAAESHPPKSVMAQGSARRTARQVPASSGSAWIFRWRARHHASVIASAAARVAGACQPSSATYPVATRAANPNARAGGSRARRAIRTTQAAMSPT
jgi:hypothetical protein